MKPLLKFMYRARGSCAWIIVLLLHGMVHTAHAGLGDEPLATDHWAYEVIDELYAAGIWGSWPIGTRPWYRGDIAARVTEISDRIDFDDAHAWLISKLQSEFADDMLPEERKGDFETRLGGEVAGQAEFDPHEDALWRGRLQGYMGIGTGPWWVRIRGDIDSHGDRDPTFFGKPWQDKLTGTMDVAFFSLRWKGLALLLGRDYLRWGSGAHDVLLLNDRQPPYDMARFSYHHTYFDFSYFVTGLDSAFAVPADDSIYSTAHVKRYFAGHRLEVRPLRGLEVAVSEVVVWGGVSRQLEAYYLNPFLPYYWEQLNADRDDNPLWSFDASYLIPGGPLLYGEFLIDDFQIDFKSEPHQVGWLLGSQLVSPGGTSGELRHFRLDPHRAGGLRAAAAVQSLHQSPRGHGLGYRATTPSAVYLRWRQHVSQPFDLSGRFVYVGKGDRRPETPQTDGVPRGAFPSGIVEQTTEGALDFFYYPTAHVHVRLDLGYRWQANADHIEGLDRNGGFVSLSVALMGWHTGSF